MTPRTEPAAVLWDFDGTLVDTEPYWIATEVELIGEYGGSWSHEQGLQLVGNDLLVSGRMIIEQTGIPLTPEEVVDRLLDGVVAHIRQEIPWRPGVRDLLADLARRGVPCGLVTMSYPRFIAPVLEALPDDTFACIVTGDQVSVGKPDPEAYLRAADLLGLVPGECVAIEDSLPGATSAAEAGCRVVVVPAHVPVVDNPAWTVLTELPATAADLAGAAPIA
ncbi:MAG TPA: HAD family phosphatase [Marmoricola sp.]